MLSPKQKISMLGKLEKNLNKVGMKPNLKKCNQESQIVINKYIDAGNQI